MNFLQIFQLLLALAPEGVLITKDVLTIIASIEAAINGTPGTPAHAAAIEHLNTLVAPKA